MPDGRKGRRISIKFIARIDDKESRPLIINGTRPQVVLRLSRERESLDHNLLRFHGLIGANSLIILIAVMFSVSRSIKRGLRPLLRIRNEISQITPESIDRRITDTGQPQELEPIARQFNQVLAQIERAFIREREFSADVAHELRTPVTEIRSLAEVGMRWPDEKDIRSYFADIHESSRHLERLIENLLLLCRSEEGGIELDIAVVELKNLLDRIYASLAQEVGMRKITISQTDAKLPALLTDERLFELLLSNLLFNAISHSPEGSSVAIKLQSNQDFCQIEIENPMLEPLSNEDMNMIFDRFWRKDPARESGKHAGIGLALVKSYTACLNLELQASVSEAGLFCIRLGKIKIA